MEGNKNHLAVPNNLRQPNQTRPTNLEDVQKEEDDAIGLNDRELSEARGHLAGQ
jgi:hypothetical protein